MFRKSLSGRTGETGSAYDALSASPHLPEHHQGRFARRLIYTIVSAFIGGLVWAALTPVDEITTGGGSIETSNRIEKVEHLDGGIVERLFVSVGDPIEPGQTLLHLDAGTLLREREKFAAQMAALNAEWRRVTHILENGDLPPDSAELTAFAEDEQVFWAEQAYLSVQLDLLATEAGAITDRLESIAKRRDLHIREQRILEDQVARYRRAEFAVRRNDLDALERQLLQAERALVDLATSASGERFALRQNELGRKEILAARRRDAAERRADLERLRVEVTKTLEELQARIDRTVVRAATAGTVLNLSITTPREVLAPGDLVAEIVPANSPVQAKVEISADRIGAVELGMPARLRIETYDFTRFGTLEGQVTAISPSSVRNERDEQVFRVTIDLPGNGTDFDLAGREVRPGMTVTADIISERKTVLSYLLKPLRALNDRAFTEA